MNKRYFGVFLFIATGILLTSTLTGCFSIKKSMIYDGRIRTYLIHLPVDYNNAEECPLIIVLHGGGGNSRSIEKKTGMNDLSDEQGFIVVYPDGTGKLRNRFLTWNSGYCCGYAFENNIDDVGFIKALIDKLQKTFSIDSKRIYITGYSNGGMMAYRLGSELSDIIAAIAPVAGSIGGYATEDSLLWLVPDPLYPVSVIAFHGMLDENVAYFGGHGNKTTGTRIDLSVNDSISFWVEHNGCDYIPQTNVSESGNVIVDTYSNGNNSTEIILYSIVNGEHWWPGSDKDPYQEIYSSEIIWDFFKTHHKEN